MNLGARAIANMFLACAFVASTPSFAQVDGVASSNSESQLIPVAVDNEAFEKALSLFGCMKDAQSEYREELRALSSPDARGERLNDLCGIASRNSEIVDRLRLVHPEWSDDELIEENKRLVLLAAFHKPRDGIAASTREEAVPAE